MSPNRPIRPRTGARGFTLLETMFALLVLCVGVAFLAATMGGTIRSDANNQAQNASLYLANQKAEQIVRQLRCIETGGCTATSYTDSYGNTTSVSPGGAVSFASAPSAGYGETVTLGAPGCSVGGGDAYCATYDLRWSISAPVLAPGAAAGGASLYQISVAARAQSAGNFAPVQINVAIP